MTAPAIHSKTRENYFLSPYPSPPPPNPFFPLVKLLLLFLKYRCGNGNRGTSGSFSDLGTVLRSPDFADFSPVPTLCVCPDISPEQPCLNSAEKRSHICGFQRAKLCSPLALKSRDHTRGRKCCGSQWC